jgi:hypothetical protein
MNTMRRLRSSSFFWCGVFTFVWAMLPNVLKCWTDGVRLFQSL